ncbi:hypothetical protein NPS29_27365 [Pseudomonas putida]|uniref:surface-adhesin E family protein n=1 Tax=Pseudomonas putida TaxID=303 RepID=UPI00236451AC|nr:hypothetical protein [Pseudomonas putida]MDD1969059.1 hypothetical protein [Pseudomonas putida]
MDATLYRACRLPLLGFTLMFAGCQAVGPTGNSATSYTKSEPSPGATVFSSVINEQPLPASIVREGTRVTYMVVAAEGQTPRYLSRFDVDCSRSFVRMAYGTSKGMVPFADFNILRLEHYLEIPDPQREQYLGSTQFKQICAQTAAADWRVISTTDQQDVQLIDQASVSRNAGDVTFWTARVLSTEELLPDNTHVLSQVRRQLLADCTQQRLTTLSTFKLSPLKRVISGSVESELKPLSSQSLPAEDRQLLDAACAGPQALAARAAYQEARQEFFDLPTPEVAPAVTSAIDSLHLPAPEKSLSKLKLTAREFAFGKWQEEQGRGRLARSMSYVPAQPGKQLTENVRGRQYQLRQITFRGLIELAQSSALRSVDDRISVRTTAITGLRFSGDWAAMPVGAKLQYTVQAPAPRYGKANALIDTPFICDVESQQPASTLYAGLSGDAKLVNCSGDHFDVGTGVMAYAYLADYGLFVPTQFIGRSSQVKWTIEQAQ